MLLFKYKISRIQYLQTKHCLHGDEEGWYIKCLKKYLYHKKNQAGISTCTCFSENDYRYFCSYHYY